MQSDDPRAGRQLIDEMMGPTGGAVAGAASAAVATGAAAASAPLAAGAAATAALAGTVAYAGKQINKNGFGAGAKNTANAIGDIASIGLETTRDTIGSVQDYATDDTASDAGGSADDVKDYDN